MQLFIFGLIFVYHYVKHKSKKMERIKLYILFVISFVIFTSQKINTFSVDIPSEIIVAFKTGDATVLSKYFNTNLELAINSNDDIYSREQAELILKDFFAKNIPNSFTILHKSGKEESRYAIGNLSTTNGKFRVTILVKLKDNTPLIHQLRIQKEDGQ